MTTIDNPAAMLFTEATKLAQNSLLVDAVKKFLAFVDEYPENELADDALFNAGMCYFHIHSFADAIRIFKETIEKYPDSEISMGEGKEHGKTAAKCHYALVNCFIGLNDLDLAKSHASVLENYPESFIYTPIGEKIAYAELAKKAIDAYLQIKNLN